MKTRRWIATAAFAVLSALTLWQGFRGGAHLVWVWLASAAAGAVLFALLDDPLPAEDGWGAADWGVLAAILALLVPFYTWYLYDLPARVNADEIILLNVQKHILSQPLKPLEVLPLYYWHPGLNLIILGLSAQAMGGLSLEHGRLVVALIGLLTVACGYRFFRLHFPRGQAAAATLLLGFNHTLIVLSRMAMWNNSALLVVLAALTLLSLGVWRRSLLWAYLGGAVAGLSFYTYAAARWVLPLWAVFVIVYRFRQETIRLRWFLPAHTLAALIGMSVVIHPIVISVQKAGPQALNYSRHQFLFFAEGRQDQRRWTYSETNLDAIRKNIRYGLGALNNRMWDMGNTYPNQNVSGTGFVDPLTGALLWIGILALLLGGRAGPRAAGLACVAAFIVSWLSFSFLINKAPSYPRLLVLLPVVIVLAVIGLYAVADGLQRLLVRRPILIGPARRLLPALLVCAAVGWNVQIMAHALRKDMEEGDTWGNTGRYIAARSSLPRYHHYMIGDDQRPYYYWGHYYWASWANFFSGPHQPVEVLTPESIREIPVPPPFTLFLNREVWSSLQSRVGARYREWNVWPMRPDGSVLAVEVLRPM